MPVSGCLLSGFSVGMRKRGADADAEFFARFCEE